MPFVIVHGIFESTATSTLTELRRSIVASVSKTMGLPGVPVPASWIRPIFVRDMLGESEVEADGCNTIYVRVDTAMFSGKFDEEDESWPLVVVSELAQVIWDAFGGRYEVEVFIGELNPKWKKLLKATS